MAFTKVVGPGIHTLAQLRTHNIHSAGIVTATRFVGEIGAGTGNTSTFTNVNVTGNLTVQGDTTTLNTTLRNVELLRVAANTNTTAGIITQTGTGDILNLFDATTEVMTVVDGGKVGIGITNPADLLTIAAGANTLAFGAKDTTRGNHIWQLLNNDGSGNAEFRLYKNSVSGTHAQSINFATSGDANYILDGKFGVGIAAPTAKLEVLNNSNIEVLRLKDTHFNKYLTIRGGGSPNRMVIDSYEGGGGGADIDFASNGSTKVRITSGGEVLIGTTTDANVKLDVEGSLRAKSAGYVAPASGTGLEIYYATNTLNDTPSGYLLSYDRSSSAYKKINYDASEHKFRTSGSEKVRIDSSGRIIAGRTASDPTEVRMTLQGNSASATSYTVLDLRRGEAADAIGDVLGYIRFSDTNITSGNQNYALIYAQVDKASTNASDNPGRLVFATTRDGAAGPTKALMIDSDGKFNTGEPAQNAIDDFNITATGTGATLSLNRAKTGNASDGDLLGALSFQSYPAGQGYTSSEAGIRAYAATGQSGSAAPTELRFYTKPSTVGPGAGANERLRITPDGRFSLGQSITASPGAVFHIDWDSNNLLMLDNNSASTQKMFFASQGAVHAQIYGTTSSGAFTIESDPNNNHSTSLINFKVDGSEKLRITSGGLVGINTATPTAQLSFLAKRSTQTYPPICFQTAHGTGLADAAISTTDDSGGTDIMMGSNVYMGQNGAFVRYMSGYGSAAVRCQYTGRTIFYNKSGNNAPVESMRIDGNGYVGVKRSTPLANLHTTNNELALGANPTSAAAPNATYDGLVVDGEAGSFINIRSRGNGSDSYGRLAFSDDVRSRGYIEYRHKDGTGDDWLGFATAGNERLRIDSGGTTRLKRSTISNSATTANNAALYLDVADTEGSASSYHLIGFGYRSAVTNAKPAFMGYQSTTWSGSTYGDLVFGTRNNTTGSNEASVRMRIDNNGLLGLNRSPSYSGIYGGTQLGMHIGGSTAPFLRITSDTGSQADLVIQAGNSGARSDIASLADNGDIAFWTKKAGAGLKEIFRIRRDGFVETMYGENTGSYAVDASPTPRIRVRNDNGGDGIISSAQFFAIRGSGAASIFDIGVITTSQDYESNLIISSRDSSSAYSEKLRIQSNGSLRMLYGNNAKQAYVLRNTFRGITGHSSTGDQWFRCALMAARTAFRVTVSTSGGNYGPGYTAFTCLRSWDSTTFYVFDKVDAGSQYATQVRMQSDNGGDTWYMEIRANLSSTSQGFDLSVTPVAANAGVMTTHLQYYGSNMTNLTNTSSAQDI